MQYSNRSSYKNRSEQSFYFSRQYNNNQGYGNSRYGNSGYEDSRYGNSGYEDSRYGNLGEFDEMFVIRASQEVYFNKFSNKDIFYNIEDYYKIFDFHYFIDFFLLYK